MRARRVSVAVLGVLACLSIPVLAQDKTTAASIRALESKWTDAYTQRQIAELAALLADDYVITTEDGTTFSKVGFISHNMNALRVDIAEMSTLKVRLHENVAVVTGDYHESGESGGKPYDDHDKLTDVWMKIGGKWQLIASTTACPRNCSEHALMQLCSKWGANPGMNRMLQASRVTQRLACRFHPIPVPSAIN
jgi:ketosteroid isomerase-like protein